MNNKTINTTSFCQTSKALGTQMLNFDANISTESDNQTLIEAWHNGLVCRIRNQKLSATEFIRFARIFGTPEKALNQEKVLTSGLKTPELMIVSNVKSNGHSIGHLGAKEAYWHTDMCYTDSPPIASILYAIEVPSTGGNTEFMDMYNVYNSLPAELKELISNLSIKHDHSYTAVGDLRFGYEPVIDVVTCPGAIHPLVQVHPITKKTYLYLGRRLNAYITGHSVIESEKLLDKLWKYTLSPEFTWTQEWRAGDILIWDNRCTMHRRDSFAENSRRIMWRTQVQASPNKNT